MMENTKMLPTLQDFTEKFTEYAQSHPSYEAEFLARMMQEILEAHTAEDHTSKKENLFLSPNLYAKTNFSNLSKECMEQFSIFREYKCSECIVAQEVIDAKREGML